MCIYLVLLLVLLCISFLTFSRTFFCFCFVFFFNDPATTEIYTYLHTLSLHDALPILSLKTASFRLACPTRSSAVFAFTSGRKSAMLWRICASSINLPTIWPLSASSMCPSGALAIKPSGNFTCLRSEEHTSELQSLMRISYAVFCLKKKKKTEKH